MVEASKQGSGHLYVQTGDCLVSVTGTIFSVDHGALGSRVGVIEGEVHVAQPGRTTVLEPGDQVATRAGMTSVPLAQQIAWSRNIARYAEMLASVRAIGREIDARVPMPAMRTSTRLLDRVPEGTVVYAAFPNLRMILATQRETHGVNDYSLGATLFTRSNTRQCPPIALPGVVDRIGGGDAFAGGFLYAHMSGMPDTDALTFALYSAAAKHGQSGDASHASADDIRALMAGGGLDVKR